MAANMGVGPQQGPTNRGMRGRGNRPGQNPGGRNTGGARRPNTQVPHGVASRGKAGEALTNDNPEGYISMLLDKAGLTTYSNSPRDIWARQQLTEQLLNEYGTWSQGRQQDSVKDYFRSQYGAGYLPTGPAIGKKGKHALQYQQGSFADRVGKTAAEWKTSQANLNPEGTLRAEMSNQGGYAPGGGNQGFQSWFDEVYSPQLQKQFETKYINDPGANEDFDKWVSGQNVLGRAQRAYAMRPGTQRTMKNTDQAGRWSWWN